MIYATEDQLEIARCMRAEGASYKAIGVAIGRPAGTVAYWLNPELRAKQSARDKAVRRETAHAFRDSQPPKRRPRAVRPRKPRQILADPETKAEAFAAFARGDITAAAMMARITVGEMVRPAT